MEHPEDRKKRSRSKPTSKDLPGSGAARKSGEAIETRKSKNRAAATTASKALKSSSGGY